MHLAVAVIFNYAVNSFYVNGAVNRLLATHPNDMTSPYEKDLYLVVSYSSLVSKWGLSYLRVRW